MKKVTVLVLAAVLAVFVGSWTDPGATVAYAAGHGGGGGWRGGGGGGWHGGHGGHGGGHFNVWFGPGWGWDPFFYPYYPYYPSYPAYQPPVVIQQPEQYVVPESQPQQTSYWYYCQNPKGYYPYVKRCPGGWMKVVPSPAPPEEGE
jgi:hypothetical protein